MKPPKLRTKAVKLTMWLFGFSDRPAQFNFSSDLTTYNFTTDPSGSRGKRPRVCCSRSSSWAVPGAGVSSGHSYSCRNSAPSGLHRTL